MLSNANVNDKHGNAKQRKAMLILMQKKELICWQQQKQNKMKDLEAGAD